MGLTWTHLGILVGTTTICHMAFVCGIALSFPVFLFFLSGHSLYGQAVQVSCDRRAGVLDFFCSISTACFALRLPSRMKRMASFATC